MQTQIDTNWWLIWFYFDNFSGFGRSHSVEQRPGPGDWGGETLMMPSLWQINIKVKSLIFHLLATPTPEMAKNINM